MDDIQFWVYIIFGLIYFLSRSLKKRRQQKSTDGPVEEVPSGKKPMTFEELLREFTQEPEEQMPEPKGEVINEQNPEEVEVKKPVPEEGKTRRFSDEESRKVYEESIKRAEGFDIQFEPDENFRSKLTRSEDEVEDDNIAVEIRDGLSGDEARKAIIYAEILNRRY